MTDFEFDTGSLEFRELVARLVDVLQQHLAHHRSLADILREKKAAVVELRHADLERIVDLEREVIGAIGVAEEERIAITQDLAVCAGRPRGSDLKLRELVQFAGEEHREELLDLRDELRAVADELDRLNELNRTLLLDSMSHINLYVATLAGRDPDAKTYGKSGTAHDGGLPSMILDRRI